MFRPTILHSGLVCLTILAGCEPPDLEQYAAKNAGADTGGERPRGGGEQGGAVGADTGMGGSTGDVRDGVDSDGDGLTDDEESTIGTDPGNTDTDADGLGDGDEQSLGTDPLDADTDDDGLEDGVEMDVGTNPLDPDTDTDGISDGEEQSLGSDPLDSDTDDDGLSDGEEQVLGTQVLNADSDGDGLSDGEEVASGSDPLSTDTDGDGYLDNIEVASYTDPNDPNDHPYTGGWTIDSCRHDLAAVASARPQVGSVAPNFTLMDQYGDSVKLHDFCGQAVLIVVGAEWCGPCQSYRSTAQSYWDAFHHRGLMIVDLLGQDYYGGTPSQATLASWAGTDDYAVLADSNFSISFTGYMSSTIPSVSLLTDGGVVVALDGYGSINGRTIEGALP